MKNVFLSGLLVKNAFLFPGKSKGDLRGGEPKLIFDLGFIPTQIVSTRHALAAVFRAGRDFEAGRLKSRNVHAEVVVALGGNNNVSFLFPFFSFSLSFVFILGWIRTSRKES